MMRQMNGFAQTLFSNWNFLRCFRLGLGLFIGSQAIAMQDGLSGFFAAFLLYQALANTGCGLGGCAPVQKSAAVESDTPFTFEEIPASSGK